MNAKLEKREDRWIVVVSSVAGEVRLDITERISSEIQFEVDARIERGAVKDLGEEKARRLEALEEAFEKVRSAVNDEFPYPSRT